MDDKLIKLIKAQRKWGEVQAKIEEMEMFLNESDLDIDDLILDVLGFPQDNTLTKQPDDPDYFCRDYCMDILFDETMTPNQILEELKKEIEILKRQELSVDG